MKRIYLLLVARYHDLRTFAHEVRHDDALRRLNAAQDELIAAKSWADHQVAALQWARTDRRNAWHDVQRLERHRALGI